MAQEQKTNYNDIVLTAIDTVVSKRLEDLDYDKTIIATIVNADGAASGHYIVNDGAIDFDAYCSNNSYVVDDQVYVTVPKGDFTQQKIIISKYVANNDQGPIGYISPLGQVYIISDDIVSKGKKLFNNTILANGRENKKIDDSYVLMPPGGKRLVWEQNLELLNDSIINNNAVFDVLAVKAGFICSIGTSFNVTAGNYGISIKLTYVPVSDQSNPQPQSVEYDLDTADMSGNPYYFLSNSIQEKKIDITNIGNIKKIEVYLYQKGNFEYYDTAVGETLDLPATPIDEKLQIDDTYNNIIINSLQMYFGVDTTKMNDNTFQIYTSSSSTFDVSNTEKGYNTKKIIPIWFNKGEGDKYLGYSDGVYDFYDSTGDLVGHNYTEDAYAEMSKYYEVGSSLMQEDLSSERIPSILELLSAYKYGNDIINLLNTLYTKIAVNMANCYNSVYDDCARYQNTENKNSCKQLRDNLIANGSRHANLVNALNTLRNVDADSANYNQSFLAILKSQLQGFGGWYIDGTALSQITVNDYLTGSPSGLYTLIQNLRSQFNIYCKYVGDETDRTVNSFFEQFGTYVDADFKLPFLAWWDTWRTLQAQCSDIFNQIYDILGGTVPFNGNNVNTNVNKETICFQYGSAWVKFNGAATSELKDFETEHSEFLATYANRYCLYWYKYEDGADLDPYMPKNWRRLDDYTNHGLPDTYIQGEDLNYYYDVRPKAPEVSITVGKASLRQERIQAILIYNHQIFKSNILTFYNEQPVVDATTADATNGLYISLTDAQLAADGTLDMSTDTYNSKETYQLYGMSNYLVNSAEAYKKRKIRARYSGTLATDEYLRQNCIIYWYIPINSTMLTVSREDLIAAGYSYYHPSYEKGQDEFEAALRAITDPENLPAEWANMSEQAKQEYVDRKKAELRLQYYSGYVNPKPPAPYGNQYIDGYIMVYRKTATQSDGTLDPASTELIYQIKDYYVPTATNNTIKCRVVKNGYYTYEAEQYFTFASYGTNGTDYSLAITPTNKQVAVRDDSALNLNVKLYNTNGEDITLDYSDKIQTKLLKPTFQFDLKNNDPVFITSDGQVVSVYRVKPSGQQTSKFAYQYAILEATTTVEIEYQQLEKKEGDTGVEDRNNKEADTRKVNLKSYYPIPWASDNYYIEGASVIVYDSSGSKPSYYEDPFVLYDMKTGHRIADQKWGIGYVTTNSNNATSSLIREYMPKLKETEGAYRLQVPSMFLSDNDFYCYVYCYVGDTVNADNIKWVQPIYITQNRFSSPMLNAWDGELTIDEKNGTILSSMVGAGKKESDNSFSGVLMGEVAAQTGDMASTIQNAQTGLYGFHHGEQSFGFLDTGAAFIGKSGRGRIWFDGNSGRIQSESYQTKIDGSIKSGMMIDLDDGMIDMRGGYKTDEQTQAWRDGNAYNNEQFYVDGGNQTKFEGSGSQVLIQVKDPYLTIKSPSVVYTDESEFSNTLNAFWDDIDYQKNKAAWKKYLQDTFKLQNGSESFNSTITVVKKTNSNAFSGTNFTGNLGTNPKTKVYYRVAEDLTFEDMDATSFWSKVKNSDIINGENGGEEDETGAIIYKPLIHKNDYIYIESVNKYQVITSRSSNYKYISRYPTMAEIEAGCFVNQFGIKISQIGDNSNKYTLPEGKTVDELATLLAAATKPLAQKQNIDLLTESVANSLKVILLRKSDYALAKKIYQQEKPAVELMKVGIDKYFLQTDNYFKATDQTYYSDGAGLKFDLMKGTLDAYDFTLTAASPNKSSVRLSSISPFFQIRFNQESRNRWIDLINIGNSNYVLQSQNWWAGAADDPGEGTQFDMVKGKLTSFNFTLDARDAKHENGFWMSTTGRPYLEILNGGKSLLNITNNQFLLHSKDWVEPGTDSNPTTGYGVEINMNNGNIRSYSKFSLSAYNYLANNRYNGSFIKMNSNGSPYFQIHFKDGEQFERATSVTSGSEFIQFKTAFGTSKAYTENVTYYAPSTITVTDTTTGIPVQQTNGYKRVPYKNIIKDSLQSSNEFYYNNLYVRKLNSARNIWFPLFATTFKSSAEYYTYDSGRYKKASPTSGNFSQGNYFEKTKITDASNDINNYYLAERAYYSDNKTLENDLINITNSEYVLTTQNYLQDYQGLKFDMSEGNLESYSHFNLKAINTSENIKKTSSEGHYKGSYVQLSSYGSEDKPYFRVHYKNDVDSQEVDLLNITRKDFVIKSHNWREPSTSIDIDGEGLKFDVGAGSLQAYNNFDLLAVQTTDQDYAGSYVRISNVGDPNKPYIKVHYVYAKTVAPLKARDVRSNVYELLNLEEEGYTGTAVPHYQYKSIVFYDSNHNEITDDVTSANFESYYGRKVKSPEEISGGYTIYRLKAVSSSASFNENYIYLTYDTQNNRYDYMQYANATEFNGETKKKYYLYALPDSKPSSPSDVRYLNNRFYSNDEIYFGATVTGSGINKVVRFENSQAVDLLEITKNTFDLRSQNWIEGSTGTHLDMTNGNLTSYSFDLLAKNTDVDDPYYGSYLQISSSGSPFIKIYHKYTDENNSANNRNRTLFEITNDKFYLTSHNYVSGTSGLYFNVASGQMTGYKNDKEYFSIGSSHATYALRVINNTDGNTVATGAKITRIAWDGTLETNVINAYGGYIGGWSIDSTDLWTSKNGGTAVSKIVNDTFRLASGIFSRAINGHNLNSSNVAQPITILKMAIGQNFGVDQNGILYASGGHFSGEITATTGKIGGWVIDDPHLKSSDGKIILSPTGYGSGNYAIYSNGTFYVTTGGKMYATDGKIGQWTVGSSGLSSGGSGGGYGGGTISGGTISGSQVTGSAITGGTLDIGPNGCAVGGGNFSVDSGGNITVKEKATMTLPQGSSFILGDTIEISDHVVKTDWLQLKNIKTGVYSLLSVHDYEFSNYFTTVGNSSFTPSNAFSIGKSWTTYGSVSSSLGWGWLTVRKSASGSAEAVGYVYAPTSVSSSLGSSETYTPYCCTGAKVKITGAIYPNESAYDDYYNN